MWSVQPYPVVVKGFECATDSYNRFYASTSEFLSAQRPASSTDVFNVTLSEFEEEPTEEDGPIQLVYPPGGEDQSTAESPCGPLKKWGGTSDRLSHPKCTIAR